VGISVIGYWFSLAANPVFFYSGFTVVMESVKALEESRLAGAAVVDRMGLSQIESAKYYESYV
jgi:hypothetical protein